MRFYFAGIGKIAGKAVLTKARKQDMLGAARRKDGLCRLMKIRD